MTFCKHESDSRCLHFFTTISPAPAILSSFSYKSRYSPNITPSFQLHRAAYLPFYLSSSHTRRQQSGTGSQGQPTQPLTGLGTSGTQQAKSNQNTALSNTYLLQSTDSTISTQLTGILKSSSQSSSTNTGKPTNLSIARLFAEALFEGLACQLSSQSLGFSCPNPRSILSESAVASRARSEASGGIDLLRLRPTRVIGLARAMPDSSQNQTRRCSP